MTARAVREAYFGHVVIDEHRWLEALDSPEARRWLVRQGAHARARLESLPGRRALLARINALTDAVDKVIDVQRAGNRYFYFRFARGEHDRGLYVRRGVDGPERLVVRGDGATSGGPSSITEYRPSPDGRFVAYVAAGGGSDVGHLRIVETDTGRRLSERIDGIRFGVGDWTPDGEHIVYTRLRTGAAAHHAAQYEGSRVYLHRLGTPVETDRVVFGPARQSARPFADVDIPTVSLSAGSPYAVGEIHSGVSTPSRFYVKRVRDLARAGVRWAPLARTEDRVAVVEMCGRIAYVLTCRGAARFHIRRISLRAPRLRDAPVVFDHPTQVVKGLAAAKDALYVITIEDGRYALWRVAHDATAAEPIAPAADTGLSLCGVSPLRSGTLLAVRSWLRPTAIVRYEPARRRTRTTRLSSGAACRTPRLRAITTFVDNGDASVPLTILGKAGLVKDGANPTLLSAYGAYGIVATDPFFRPSTLAWLERGGLLAFAGVRGGGEKGERWHAAGMKERKPNSWRDLIACAEYLVRKRYTAPAHLGAHGFSAGALVVGNAMVERPDLFGAVVLSSSLTNVLRAETTANGRANVEEFGSLATARGFRSLRRMDLYHNLQTSAIYPPVLITAGMNDSRVPPWMSAKLAARLGRCRRARGRVLLRVEWDGGHVAARSKAHDNAWIADIYAFLLRHIGRHRSARPA